MPLYLFYTTVQKSRKWPKSQIKGGPALTFLPLGLSLWNLAHLFIKFMATKNASIFFNFRLRT